MINVKITKKDGENAIMVLRNFSTRFKRSGILPKVKGEKFESRKLSSFFRKKQALRKIEKTAKNKRLDKLGKLKR